MSYSGSCECISRGNSNYPRMPDRWLAWLAVGILACAQVEQPGARLRKGSGESAGAGGGSENAEGEPVEGEGEEQGSAETEQPEEGDPEATESSSSGRGGFNVGPGSLQRGGRGGRGGSKATGGRGGSTRQTAVGFASSQGGSTSARGGGFGFASGRGGTTTATTAGGGSEASSTVPTGGCDPDKVFDLPLAGGAQARVDPVGDGELCVAVSGPMLGWGCSGLEGRTITVNGKPATCTGAAVPSALSDKYRYFKIGPVSASAGQVYYTGNINFW